MLTIFAVTVLLLSPFDGDVPVERLLENGKYTEAEAILKQRLQTSLSPTDRTKVLLELVEVYRLAGRPLLAAPLVDESVRLAMQMDDGIMRGRALCSLAKGTPTAWPKHGSGAGIPPRLDICAGLPPRSGQKF